MQFREELLNNPSTESGPESEWACWFNVVARSLSGGENGSRSYYGPGLHEVVPPCFCSLAESRRRAGESVDAPSDSDKLTGISCIVLYAPDKLYIAQGPVIDWREPFPSVEQRGRIVEWIEAWLDRVQLIESEGIAPWEQSEPELRAIQYAAALAAERTAAKLAVDQTNRADPTRSTPTEQSDALHEHDVAILKFLNSRPNLRRKVSDIIPDRGPQDRKAIAKRVRALADRVPPLIDYPKGGRRGAAILPAGTEALNRATAQAPH